MSASCEISLMRFAARTFVVSFLVRWRRRSSGDCRARVMVHELRVVEKLDEVWRQRKTRARTAMIDFNIMVVAIAAQCMVEKIVAMPSSQTTHSIMCVIALATSGAIALASRQTHPKNALPRDTFTPPEWHPKNALPRHTSTPPEWTSRCRPRKRPAASHA